MSQPFLLRLGKISRLRSFVRTLTSLSVVSWAAMFGTFLSQPILAQDIWFDPFPTSYNLFDGATSPDGKWYCAWTGYGTVKTEPRDGGSSDLAMALSPKVATTASTTHSALVLSTSAFADQVIEVDVRTLQQLRTQKRGRNLVSKPNSWEVAWIVWRFTDANNFYYFMVKPNGTELGKVQAGSQIFLATTSSPKLDLGGWDAWTIRAEANRITILVEGTPVIDYLDAGAPAVLSSGRVGLYCEDAYVQFDNVKVTSLIGSATSLAASLPNLIMPGVMERNLNANRFDAVNENAILFGPDND